MSIPGAAAVGTVGQFAYSIPIVVPPGTAGMMPSLSLDYSSLNGDGLEGWGFLLNGLAAITRCPQTVAIDNVHGSVNYQMSDRFCLNGQRLMLSTGTPYGSPGTTYSTYVADFSQVTALGTAGKGPSSFTVKLKNGTLLELGATPDSQILAVGNADGTVREWLVDKITDVKGNYLTVTYTNDQTNGQAYPTEIDYTGNATTTPNVSPYNSVKFYYAPTRGDITPTYQAGSLQQFTTLLTDVKTYNGATMVLDYQLAYRAGSTTTHSRLTSVTVCGNAGDCQAPTKFGWQGGTGTISLPTATPQTLAQGNPLSPADFNGDGLTDAFPFSTTCPTAGLAWLGTSSGTTFTAGNLTAFYNYIPSGIVTPLDYSGPLCFPSSVLVTGASPAIFQAGGLQGLYLNQARSISGGGGTVPYTNALGGDAAGNQTQASYSVTTQVQFSLFGNFRGVGFTDGFDGTKAYFSNPSGSFVPDASRTAPGGVIAADFDGDGCTDILQQGAVNGITYYCNPAVATASLPSYAGSTVVPGDFNGDGKADLLIVSNTGATLYLSTGTGLSTGYVLPMSANWLNYHIVAGDWNGDGKTDIALLSQVSGSPHLIFLSTGTGFVQVATIANSDTSVNAVVADWNSDGADDLWLQQASGDVEYTFAYTPEVIISVVRNGLNSATRIGYKPLNTNSSFYTKGSLATYPYTALDGPQIAVSQITYDNAIGGSYNVAYSYNQAVIDVTAPPIAAPKSNILTKGIVGFAGITTVDSRNGATTVTNLHTDLPYIGLLASQTTTLGGVTLSSLTNTYTTVAHFHANAVQKTDSTLLRNDLDGSPLPEIDTSITYDSFNNPLTSKQTLPDDGSTQTTTQTFNNDTTNWILNQLLTSSTVSTVGSSTMTRDFTFTPDPATGLLTQTVTEPSIPSLTLTADIGRDGFGNATSQTLSGTGISSPMTSLGFDANGEFPTSITDALLHVTNVTFDPNFGGQASQTDPNSVTTTVQYDDLGRPSLVTKPDGTKIAATYNFCAGVNGGTAPCPTYGAYVVTVTPENAGGTQNGASTTTYYDALDRVIATDVQGFNGSVVRAATSYDANGNVATTSRPYFVSGGTPQTTSYTYDALFRVTRATFPDSSKTNYGYHGLTTTVTNDKGQVTTTVLNDEGQVASVTDANSKTTSYVYDAFGDPLTVTDSAGNAITNTYDVRGRKKTMSDPDMGNWQYTYDALSDLKTQIDGNGKTTTLTYDKLARMTTRTEADFYGKWIYDTATHGIGQLSAACLVTTCTGTNRNLFVNYDTYGRPSILTRQLDGGSYAYHYAYDGDGRLKTLTYPSGFVAHYLYNTQGYLSQIQDNATSAVVWTANTRDAELHLTQQTAGNGVVTNTGFDAQTGNMLSVCATSNGGTCDGNVANFGYTWDTIRNLNSRSTTVGASTHTEQFCYDVLNRLTNAGFGAACTTGSPHVTMGYDDIGNITAKSDVCTGNCFHYGAAAGPHAITSITGTYNGATNPTFAYDANGNMTGGGGRTTAYMSFNMAASLSSNGTSLALTYDPFHQRTKMCAPDCTTPTTTTLYMHDAVSGARAAAKLAQSAAEISLALSDNIQLSDKRRELGGQRCGFLQIALVQKC